MTSTSVKRPILNHKDNAKVVISKEFEDQCDFLHSQCGSIEWSGLLIYTVEGTPNTPKEMVITIQGMYLLHIGTAASTEFDVGLKMIDVADVFPGVLDEPLKWKIGKIHSHHHMDAYHSTTDMQDLQDHCANHAYYLSLVVNFKKTYDCKMALVAKPEPTRYKFKDGLDGEGSCSVVGEEHMLVIDCDIDMPSVPAIEVPDHIRSEFESLKKAKAQTQGYKGAATHAAYLQDELDFEKENRTVRHNTQTNLFSPKLMQPVSICKFFKLWISQVENADQIEEFCKNKSVTGILNEVDRQYLKWDEVEELEYQAKLTESFEEYFYEVFANEIDVQSVSFSYSAICKELIEYMELPAFENFVITDQITSFLENIGNAYSLNELEWE